MARTAKTAKTVETAPDERALARVPVDLIDADDRLRRVNPENARALAERLQSEPMRSPVDLVGPFESGRYRLTYGGTRLEAHLINGAPDILALVTTPAEGEGEDDYRLAEIAENVERFELTVLDRSVAVARWREIYISRTGKLKSGRPRKNSASSALFSDADIDEASGQFSASFSESAQQAFRLSRRAVFDALKIASISAVARDRIAFHTIAGSKTELLALAAETPERQIEIARLLTDKQAGSVSDAIAIIDKVPAPKGPSSLDRVSNSFSRLHLKDQEAFFELHEAAIKLWLMKRRK